MSDGTPKAVILDACIFLEFEPIRQIDWRKLCGADEIQLILTIPVINALDKYKTDPRRQARAERALKDIREIWDSGGVVRDGVMLVSIDTEIRREAFPTSYSPDSDDDHILLLLADYRVKHNTIEVLLATDDGGMELKCRTRGVGYVRPDPSQRLPNVSDEAAKELQRLRQETESLKTRQPNVVVGFLNSDRIVQFHSFQVGIQRDFERVDLPVKRRRTPSDSMTFDAIGSEDFDEYVARCVAHNENIDLLATICDRAFIVQIAIGNSGTAPAHNVDIHIRFPKPVILLKEKAVEVPTPPERRQHLDMIHTQVFNMSDIHPPFENAWSKIEKNGDEYLLRGNIKVLKQHQPELMDAIVVAFHRDFEPSAFHADCRITANELPTPIEQTLHFANKPKPASSHLVSPA